MQDIYPPPAPDHTPWGYAIGRCYIACRYIGRRYNSPIVLQFDAQIEALGFVGSGRDTTKLYLPRAGGKLTKSDKPGQIRKRPAHFTIVKR